MPVDIAERKRRAIRGELSEIALGLLTDRTFESLTIDEVAAAAGVSRRTFFRYFTSKEDVVFAFLDQWAVRLAADIVARPADEDPVMAVQTSFRQLTAAYDHRALALVRLVRETPSLQLQERINRDHLRSAVVNALAERLGLDAERDMRPQILATIERHIASPRPVGRKGSGEIGPRGRQDQPEHSCWSFSSASSSDNNWSARSSANEHASSKSIRWRSPPNPTD